MGWLCLICASLIWTTVVSTIEAETDNVPEASSNQKCCPCPEPGQVTSYLAGRGALGRSPGALSQSDLEALGTSLVAVDDCPCRFRSADSEGSASMFFPSAMRAIRPFVSSDSKNEETKPLLHPEVDLASSVLETLREATDEEYREAVERDTARSVSDALKPGSILEEARKLVSVIVNPKQESVDDDEDEGESRNAASLLKTSNGAKPTLWNPPNLLTDILKLPPKQSKKDVNQIDSDVGASTNDNQVVSISPLNKLGDTLDTNLSNVLLENKNLKLDNIKIPKINEILDNIKERISYNSKAAQSVTDKTGNESVLARIIESIPKIKTSNQKTTGKENDLLDLDNSQSSSNLEKQYLGLVDDRLNTFSDKSVNSNSSTNDVFPIIDIKKSLLRAKSDHMKTKSENYTSGNEFLDNVKKTIEDSRKLLRPLNLFNIPKLKPVEENVENKSNDVLESTATNDDGKISTEIIDIIPNSSAIKTNDKNVNSLSCLDSDKKDYGGVKNVMLQQPTAKTKIIDTIPQSSMVDEIIDGQSNGLKSGTNSESDESSMTEETVNESGVTTSTNSKEDSFDENEDMEQILEEIDNMTSENNQMDTENLSENENFSKGSGDISDVDSFQDQNNAASELHDVVPDNFEEISEISNPKAVIRNEFPTNDESINYNSFEDENINTRKPVPLRKKFLDRLENMSETLPKSLSQKIIDESKESDDDKSELSISDLQNMSNSLLDKEKTLIDVLAKRLTEQKTKTDTTKITTEDDISESNLGKQMTSESRNECLSDISPNSDVNLKSASTTIGEMSSEASERVSSVVKPSVVRASLLPRIVQPLPSLFNRPDNIFNRQTINLPDLFSNPLATSKTPNIFNDRAISKEINRNAASKQDIRMSSMASKSAPKTLLAPLNLFEDINLDVLQLKPLDLSQSSLPALPRLNLNSYKAKLPVPDLLALKPVILESSVRNNKGVIGAAMTFGRNKSGPKGKSSAGNTAADILGNPIVLPSFDNLHENLLENAQNLLSTPLEATSRNIIEDTLRSGQVLSENLKVQAKSAVNDLHKNIKNSLKGTGLTSNNILSNTLTNSNLLDEISKNHEELGDKLKGIRHDFSDRLESLRNNLFDQIPSLGLPMKLPSSSLKAVQPLQLSRKIKDQTKPRSKKPKLSTSKRGKNKSLNIISESSVISPKFVESPLPKIEPLENANLKFTPKNSIKIPHLKSKLNGKPLIDILKKPENSVYRKPLLNSKSKESKVKITFQTTPRPNFKVNPSKKANIPNFTSRVILPNTNTLRSKSSLNPLGDLNESPSELKSTHVKAPLRVPIRARLPSKSLKDGVKVARPALDPKMHSTSKLKNLKWDKSLDGTKLKSIDIYKRPPLVPLAVKQTDEHLPEIPNMTAARPSSRPRIVDDAFFAKVRDALKSRLAELSPAVNKQKTMPKLAEKALLPFDMTRSASSNTDVLAPVPEPLKENTSYTCKMLCTKN